MSILQYNCQYGGINSTGCSGCSHATSQPAGAQKFSEIKFFGIVFFELYITNNTSFQIAIKKHYTSSLFWLTDINDNKLRRVYCNRKYSITDYNNDSVIVCVNSTRYCSTGYTKILIRWFSRWFDILFDIIYVNSWTELLKIEQIKQHNFFEVINFMDSWNCCAGKRRTFDTPCICQTNILYSD